MANKPHVPGQVIVDDRGRTSLQRVRVQHHERYQVMEAPNGVIMLVPVITMTPAELSDIDRAKAALRVGDAATAAYLLGVPPEDVERVTGRKPQDPQAMAEALMSDPQAMRDFAAAVAELGERVSDRD